MAFTSAPITISKLDAARRQLQTAIELWFRGGDGISTHTLAFAAYEIIHVISKRRDPKRMDLLVDGATQLGLEYAKAIKDPANFFKHANKDAEGQIEFNPDLTEAFLIFACLGIESCIKPHTDHELVFFYWFAIHHPELLSKKGTEAFVDRHKIEHLSELKRLPKSQFFDQMLAARRLLRSRDQGA